MDVTSRQKLYEVCCLLSIKLIATRDLCINYNIHRKTALIKQLRLIPAAKHKTRFCVTRRLAGNRIHEM